MLPISLKEPLQRHLEKVEAIHKENYWKKVSECCFRGGMAIRLSSKFNLLLAHAKALVTIYDTSRTSIFSSSSSALTASSSILAHCGHETAMIWARVFVMLGAWYLIFYIQGDSFCGSVVFHPASNIQHREASRPEGVRDLTQSFASVICP